MNLYFRLLLVLFNVKRNKQYQDFLSSVEIDFRVLPSDCDVNFHLTNSRYLAFMDLARTWMMGKLGLFNPIMKKRWFPIVNATAITYVKDIKPWQKFTVATEIVGWDHKYFYIKQTFKSKDAVHAIAYVRGVFKKKGGIVTIDELIDLAGYKGQAPELHEEILHWKAMLECKKQRHK